MCVCVCVFRNMKKKLEDLIIVELFAIVKRYGFYIKPSSGNLNMWCIFWIIFNSILD